MKAASTVHLAYVHFVPPDGTALRHVREFSRAVRRLGHRIDVLAMNEVAAGESHARRLRRVVRRHLRRYLHEPKELLSNFAFTIQIVRRLRQARPNILLVREKSLLGATSLTVARRLQLPLVLEINAPVIESRLFADQYFHLPLVAEWLERRTIAAAGAVTVVSLALKEYLVSRYPWCESKVIVNPNGADTEDFSPDISPDPEVAAQLPSGPVIGFVGSFQKWHGADILGRLILEVGSARPNTRFLLVGDGPERKGVRELTSSLRDRVVFVGEVSFRRVPRLVSLFDLAVLPDHTFYACPLKVVEWMAAGKAVVAPDYGPLRELMSDGVHGILFPPRSIDSLVQAVIRLVDRPSLREALGRSARARVASSLTWEDNARRVLTICQEQIDSYS